MKYFPKSDWLLNDSVSLTDSTDSLVLESKLLGLEDGIVLNPF